MWIESVVLGCESVVLGCPCVLLRNTGFTHAIGNERHRHLEVGIRMGGVVSRRVLSASGAHVWAGTPRYCGEETLGDESRRKRGVIGHYLRFLKCKEKKICTWGGGRLSKKGDRKYKEWGTWEGVSCHGNMGSVTSPPWGFRFDSDMSTTSCLSNNILRKHPYLI